MFKSCLNVLLGATCLVVALSVETGLDAASRVSLLTPEDAVAVQGTACPYNVLNANDVCTGADRWNWCSGPGGFCSSSTCGYTCSSTETQNYVRTWPATNPCYPATSTNVNCPATTTTLTCYTGFLWVCYCANPTIVVNCPAAAWAKWSNCN